MDPDSTPLLSALMAAAQRQTTAFHTPGHKRGQGASAALRALVGSVALGADLPELPDLDNLFAPTGPIRAAQDLAAQTFGAEATYFLANGSTCGIEAAVLTTCGPEDRILVPRNVHGSVLSALVLSGATPVFVEPMTDPDWDLAWGLTPSQVAAALAQVPDIQVVLVVSPSYQGMASNLGAIARLVHDHGAVLIVDAAHGAHLGFHPDLPESALEAGADVVIQSTHKTLAALTQAAMLHVQGQRVDRDRLCQALQLTQSTSPNYLLLASLDAARQQMADQGRELLQYTLDLAGRARSNLAEISSLRVLSARGSDQGSPHPSLPEETFQLDLTRLTVDVSALGLTGFAADEWLHGQRGVTAELPTLRQLTFILTFGNRAGDIDHLVQALAQLVQDSGGRRGARGGVPARSFSPSSASSSAPSFAPNSASNFGSRSAMARGRSKPITCPPLTPREAFFAPQRRVPVAEAVGQISADSLCPYPPGIPLVLPGEVITAEALAQLQAIQAAGGMITGLRDALETLRIVPTP